MTAVATARRVLVTRPSQEAGRWLEGLRARGFDAQWLPLICIEPLQDDAALRAARAAAARYQAWMFVSAAAARHFLGDEALAASAGVRCWATGPGTVAALRDAGVPLQRIDAPGDDAERFDSEALWVRVREQVGAGTRVLLVRGAQADGQEAGRDWLAQQVAAAGGLVDTVAAYRRVAPRWDPAQGALAQAAARDGSIWLLSSSQAVANLGLVLPGSDWSAASAVCTHPRIAQAARAAGFGRVAVSNPPIEALAASIESLQ
ncbi:uroporphyrinogen-III synthase [Variovorax sp.]|uniref:uroporphyrinogen-III synthase n=1 Tax=Variovorax sp. TaxID=1871043 RepID=UPI0039C9F791